MKKNILRKIFLWSIRLIILTVIAFSIATYFLLQNKDRITQLVSNQLNSHLIQPINVNTVNISLIKKIPYITVEFNNVWARSTIYSSYSDTLFTVKKIYILINVFKAVKGDYNINKLVLRDGNINIYINQAGTPNYIIWKQNTSASPKEYSVQLEDISFEKIELNYISMPNKINVSSYVHSMKVSGELMSGGASLYIKSNMFINDIKKGKTMYVKNGKTYISASLIKEGDLYKITDGTARINKQDIAVNGFINNKTGETNISLTGKNIHFNSDDNIFNLDEKLTSYALVRGSVNSAVKINGNYRYKNRLNILVGFELYNGDVKLKKQGLKYVMPYLRGKYVNNKQHSPDLFGVDSLYLYGNGDTCSGNFEIMNFEDPLFKLNASAVINAVNLNSFIPEEDVVFDEGKINVSYHVKNISLNDDEAWKQFIDKAFNTKAKPVLKNIYIKAFNKTFSDINTELYLNNTLLIKKLRFYTATSDFTVDGKVSSLGNLVNKKNTWITLRSYSDKINLDDLKNNTQENSANSFPQNIIVRWEWFAGNFLIDKNIYSDVSSEINYKPGLITLKVYNSKVFEGNLKGNCALAITGEGNYKLAVLAETQSVDITNMFNAYNNFGQEFIIAGNLKGKLNANIDMKCDLSAGFDIIIPTVIANAGISIKNGELLNHEPLYKLSKYIKLEELEHIYFSELNNEIYINEQCVTIPQMQINSSAMDIEVSGKHYFDNHFEYLISVYLSDYLAKKVPDSKSGKNDFTYVERNDAKHFQLPFLIKGDIDNYTVQLNKKRAAENFTGTIQKEKAAVKKALENEFKIFSKDTIQTIKENTPDLRYELDEKKPEQEQNGKKDTENKTGLKFEWDDD